MYSPYGHLEGNDWISYLKKKLQLTIRLIMIVTLSFILMISPLKHKVQKQIKKPMPKPQGVIDDTQTVNDINEYKFYVHKLSKLKQEKEAKRLEKERRKREARLIREREIERKRQERQRIVNQRKIEQDRQNKNYYEIDAVISFYSNTERNTGKNPGDKGYGITASGKPSRAGQTIAAPPSVPLGSKVFIPGVGYRIVEDRGGAINGNHFDVYVETDQEALRLGVQHKRIRIYK